jgi:hypothetical protein
LQYHTFYTLDLPVYAGVSDCHRVYSDVVVVTEVQELISGELGAVVSDDSIGDPKLGDNALDKAYHFLGANFGHGPCRGTVPRVPRAAIYGPTTVDMTWCHTPF